MRKAKTPMFTQFATYITLMALVLVSSCDLFDKDVVPEEKQVTVGQTEFFTVPNASTIIDLKSLIRSYSQVSLSITRDPANGNLVSLSDAVFSYKPDKNFVKGRDYFVINILNGSQSLRKDSIFIHIDEDTTKFPCGLYAIQDSVFTEPSTTPVPNDIQILANDRICGVAKDDLIVSIYQNPSHGEAIYLEDSQTLRYFQNGGYSGSDQIVYKIVSPSDTSIFSLGLVTIQVGAPVCQVDLDDDFENLQVNEFVLSHFQFDVLSNDELCDFDLAHDVYSIIQEPRRGTATILENGIIDYFADAPFTTSYRDSIAYRICINDVCHTAKLRINFIFTGCEVIAANDSTGIAKGTPVSEKAIPVMQNDILCGGLQSITVVENPLFGTARATDGIVFYTPASTTSADDILRYRICNQSGVCSEANLVISRP